MKGEATANGVGDWVVFSVKHEVIVRYKVEYDSGSDGFGAYSVAMPAVMQDAFALMLDVDAEVPGFFSSGRQVFHAEIDRIGGEPQDPVAVSLDRKSTRLNSRH